MSKNFFCRRPIPGLPSTPSPASLQHTPAFCHSVAATISLRQIQLLCAAGQEAWRISNAPWLRQEGRSPGLLTPSAFTAQPCGANVNAFPRRKTDEGSQQRVLGKSGSDGDVWIVIRQSIMISLPNYLDRLFLKISLH